MSSPAGTVRHRGNAAHAASLATPKAKSEKATGIAAPVDAELDALVKANMQQKPSEWSFKAGITIITVLAFFTRFWGISHPNEVVFDEVHFGKVWMALSTWDCRMCANRWGYSSPLTTSNAPTSSMSIHHSASFSSPSWAG
jgi:hypothetical protein